MQIAICDKKKSGKDRVVPESGAVEPNPGPIAWRAPVALALVACMPLLMATSIVVVPSGMGGVRVSQIGGTLPGTLYPGVHFVTPLVESVQIFRPARSPLHCGRWRMRAKPGAKNGR